MAGPSPTHSAPAAALRGRRTNHFPERGCSEALRPCPRGLEPCGQILSAGQLVWARPVPISWEPLRAGLVGGGQTWGGGGRQAGSPLTTALLCRDVVQEATTLLRNTAGNFYINDKSTGSVVGQQPFGGARASGEWVPTLQGGKGAPQGWGASSVRRLFSPHIRSVKSNSQHCGPELRQVVLPI